MSKINYPKTSPYSSTPQSNFAIGRFVYRDIPPADDDKTIILPPGYDYRPDRLSNDLYGTPAYWWVFMVRNLDVIRDPIWDFVSGITLTLPSPSYLKKVVG